MKVFPALLEEEQSIDIDNEISEAALIAIESLVRKCSSEARTSLGDIYKLTSEKMTYDPNYQYNEEDDDQEMQEDDDEGWGSDYIDDDQDDDDDTAWKVRKSNVKIIDAIITVCQGDLNEFWIKFADLLSKRFIERDDNVKLDILKAFQNLVIVAKVRDLEMDLSSSANQ